MNLGIVGAGRLGTALAKRLGGGERTVRFAEGGDSATVAETASRFGVGHLPSDRLAEWSDVVALTVPWAAVPSAVASLGDLSGKVLWDCTNPLAAGLSGLVVGTSTSAGEEVERLAAGASVVKGVPTFADLLHSGDPLVGGRPVGLFVAGDDQAAKDQVASLMRDLPADVTDAGPLSAARFIEPAMMLLIHLAYARGMGTRIALDLVR